MQKLLTTFLMLAGLYSHGQDYQLKPTGVTAETKVVVNNLFADIEIEGVNEGEVSIRAIDYEGIPEKAKGLKPLSATGPENTGIGLYVAQKGNEIVISGASRNADDGEYVIRIPKNLKLDIDFNSWQAGDLVISEMANEVTVKSQVGDIVLINVTGPIVASTLSSDIEVVFSTVNQSFPSSISSTSGDIDVTMPATTKGDFNMSSVSGEVYTDFDFEFDGEKNMRRMSGGMSAKAKLNGGGVAMDLRCISGDIYIRKQ